ncbi:hypothetical protein [Thioalkalivibrio sulfidiphilus]|uniref:hypothetical protein n=1 Tax=Thioalkalivibrio sulfidiphilus TaxID=1033854 RepID=UPI003B36E1BC
MAVKKKARKKPQRNVAPGTVFGRAIERAGKDVARAEAKIASANSKHAKVAERVEKAKARVAATSGKAKEAARNAVAKANDEMRKAKEAVKGAIAEHKQVSNWMSQLMARATRLEKAAERELGKMETALAKKLRAAARPKRRRVKKKAPTQNAG